MELEDMRDQFKREIMTRLEMVPERLRPVIVDIDLRADDLFVEFRAADRPVVHELRARLRMRVDRLYELMLDSDVVYRPFCRTVFGYAQYMLLYQLKQATTIASMRRMFIREIEFVRVMPAVAS